MTSFLSYEQLNPNKRCSLIVKVKYYITTMNKSCLAVISLSYDATLPWLSDTELY